MPSQILCLSLTPHTDELRNTKYGYVFKKTINCMFFMYNLKFYANFENKLQGILTNVKRWNGDVAMKLGSGKYANTTFSRGQLTCTYHVELYVATKICELDQEETYKYLETDERNLVQKVKCKKKYEDNAIDR